MENTKQVKCEMMQFSKCIGSGDRNTYTQFNSNPAPSVTTMAIRFASITHCPPLNSSHTHLEAVPCWALCSSRKPWSCSLKQTSLTQTRSLTHCGQNCLLATLAGADGKECGSWKFIFIAHKELVSPMPSSKSQVRLKQPKKKSKITSNLTLLGIGSPLFFQSL